MYTRENFKKIKDLISERRVMATALADERNLELRELSLDVKDIDAELQTIGAQVFKAACRGRDITPIKERNLLLLEERKRIIKGLGYPEDYTEVKYTCPFCEDTGFVNSKMCSCFRELLIKENIKSSGMGNLIEKQSFENFNLGVYRYDEEVYKRMTENLEFAKEFAASFSSDTAKTILFAGKTGSGKTHVSSAIAKVVIEKGYEVVYDSAPTMFGVFEMDKFKSGYGPSEAESNKYLECDLLIFDDLGTEFTSSFTVSCLYNIINTRQNKGLSTIISTNISASEISEKYDDRICSRLLGRDTKILRFGGRDYRLNNN